VVLKKIKKGTMIFGGKKIILMFFLISYSRPM